MLLHASLLAGLIVLSASNCFDFWTNWTHSDLRGTNRDEGWSRQALKSVSQVAVCAPHTKYSTAGVFSCGDLNVVASSTYCLRTHLALSRGHALHRGEFRLGQNCAHRRGSKHRRETGAIDGCSGDASSPTGRAAVAKLGVDAGHFGGNMAPI